MSFDLSDEQVNALQEMHLIQPSTTPGRRRVSSSFLHALPAMNSSSSGSSPRSAPSGSVRVVSEKHKQLFMFDLPTSYDSIEGLKFIGLTEEAARDIFVSWTDRLDPETNPYDLLSYIMGHVQQMSTIRSLGLPNEEALTEVGLSAQTIAAILDSKHEVIFQTQSIEYWVIDTLTTNYNTLQSILLCIQQTGVEAVETKRKGKEVDGINTLDHYRFFKGCTVSSTKPVDLPNHTILYQGKTMEGIGGAQDNSIIDPNGIPDLWLLRTDSRGDFNSRTSAYYWTPERPVAEMYRRYAAKRSPYSQTMIIEMQVPNDFLLTIKEEKLVFSDRWKQYVWSCRAGKPTESMPEEVRKFAAADLIKGHILVRKKSFVDKIDSVEEAKVVMTENAAMTLQSRCFQWCFMKQDVVDRLAVVVRGKLHIDRYEPGGDALF